MMMNIGMLMMLYSNKMRGILLSSLKNMLQQKLINFWQVILVYILIISIILLY